MIELPGAKPLAAITRDAADPDAVAIKQDIAAAEKCKEEGSKHAKSAGSRLARKKESFRGYKGQFKKWFTDNGLSKATVYRYLKVHSLNKKQEAKNKGLCQEKSQADETKNDVTPENSPAESPESAGNPDATTPAAESPEVPDAGNPQVLL